MPDNATGIKAMLIRLTKLDEAGRPLPEEPITFTTSKFKAVKEEE
jgi:hypothetical protein